MEKLGDFYINIGTEKSCFFVVNSRYLMEMLERHPLIYYAIEEGMVCAKGGYYAGGILAFAQLINLFNKETPQERHTVAHKMLDEIPSEDNYNQVKKQFEIIAEKMRANELKKVGDKIAYNQNLERRWRILIKPPVVETDVE